MLCSGEGSFEVFVRSSSFSLQGLFRSWWGTNNKELISQVVVLSEARSGEWEENWKQEELRAW